MDDTQVIKIRSLLLEAADAIDRANAIVCKLDEEDRALLATPLDAVSSALHFELLQKLYLRYPGLDEENPGWAGSWREPQAVGTPIGFASDCACRTDADDQQQHSSGDLDR